MENIYELKEQLRIATLKQHWESLQAQLNHIESIYKNKSFGTKSIKRNYLKSYKLDFTLEVIHVDDVYIISDKYDNSAFKVETFEDYCKYYDRCAFIIEGKRFHITKTHDGISIDTGNLRHTTSSLFEGYRYEISDDVFSNICSLISNSCDNIFSSPIKNFEKENIESYKDEIDNLKDCGCDFILLDSTEIYLLRNHPFIYGKYLLKTPLSKDIILKMRDKAKELATRQESFYCCGEYIPRSDLYDKDVIKFNKILSKF